MGKPFFHYIYLKKFYLDLRKDDLVQRHPINPKNYSTTITNKEQQQQEEQQDQHQLKHHQR